MYRRALDIAGKEFERKVDVLKKEYFEFKTISEKKFDELAEELIKNYIIAKGEAKLAFRMAIHDVGKECEDMFSKEITINDILEIDEKFKEASKEWDDLDKGDDTK
ncbi:MAG: hypothetical protein M1462_04500 [Candidatus Thermoplasmatota archaeon]|nr:hypothetical protein [Ferroplasma sp.]MCL4311669.1 hypothetical protein [Candidatus Thermoplasmatota archaeon]